jgi:hypothetical protein
MAVKLLGFQGVKSEGWRLADPVGGRIMCSGTSESDTSLNRQMGGEMSQNCRWYAEVYI